MRKLFKFVTFALIGLLLVGGVGVAALMIVVNPNDLKAPIIEQVNQATGRTLIVGDISWSFFPWLKLQLQQVELSNAQGFGDKPFLRIEQTDFQIRLLALLSRRLEIHNLSFRGLDLNLIKNAEGKNNWDDISVGPAKTQANSAAPNHFAAAPLQDGVTVNDTTEGPAPAHASFTKPIIIVTGINIADSHISLDDQQKNQRVDFDRIKFSTKNIAENKAFPVTVAFIVTREKPLLKADVTIETELTADLAKQRFVFDKLQEKVQLSDPKFLDGKLAITSSANVTFDRQENTLSIRQLDFTIANMHLLGELQGALKKSPELTGELKIPVFDLKKFLAAIGKEAPKTEDPDVLGSVMMESKIKVAGDTVELTDITAKIDNTEVKGNASVVSKGSTSLSFDLALDTIDVDRYLPPKEKTTAGQGNFSLIETAVAATEKSSVDVQASEADDFRANGALIIQSMKLAKLAFDNLHMQVSKTSEAIKLGSIKADFYQGTYFGDITINTRGNTSHITTDQTFDDVQIEPVLKILSPDSRLHLTGVADINAKLAMQSGNAHTLNGTTLFVVKNGILQGIDIGNIIDTADAMIHKQNPPAKTGPDQTEFGNLSGLFTFTNGVASNNDLLLKGPRLQVKGSGTANLVTKQLNYRLEATRVKTGTDTTGVQSSRLSGITIPIKITGTFDNPTIRPDLESLIRAEMQKQIQKKVEERKAEVKEQIQQKLEEKLSKHPLLKRRIQQNLDSMMQQRQ